MKSDNKNTSKKENVANLLELMAAYQKSRVLFTFVELEISSILKETEKSFTEIARKSAIAPLAMERFLNACVTVGLLRRNSENFSNTQLTQDFLVENKEFYLGGQVHRHQFRSAPAWENLTTRLKEWQPGSQAESAPEAEDQGAKAMTEQHNLALLHGFELAKSYDFSKHKKVLDLGGGTGATSIALCKSYPKLESVVFDLPENIKVAKDLIGKEKLENRISLVGGDFKAHELPENFDIVLLANFMAVADAEENQRLLKKLHEKLPSRGVCLLSGWIIDDSHLAPALSVLFCLEDICWQAPDVERSEKIYARWLADAGFSDVRCETYLDPTKMLYGIKV